jgi:hypothetical protein
MSFDKEKAEKVKIVPAGRRTCLMCERDTDNNRLIQITKRVKVRLCMKCFKDYYDVINKLSFKRI